MTDLAQWMRTQLDRHNMTQVAAVHAGVGQTTISDVLNKGHMPTAEVLFRLAGRFGTCHAETSRSLAYPNLLMNYHDPRQPEATSTPWLTVK